MKSQTSTAPLIARAITQATDASGVSLLAYPNHICVSAGSGAWSWRCSRCGQTGSGNLAQADRFAYSHRCEHRA